MNNEMNVVGKVIDYNTSIIGTSQSSKSELGKKLQSYGYFYLDNDSLENINISVNEIKEYLNLETFNSSYNQQNIIISNIINLIKKGTKRIIFDNIFLYLDLNIKKQLISLLKKEEIRFINITSDIEDVLYTDYLIVLYDNNIAIEGKTLDVLKEERILKRIGLNLPFIVDLSIQLKYYGLVDQIYLKTDELVEKLWK